uniref:Uncharacterized protein n=1 Tax=Rhizophora mucronata TaxID=61149 RepID=A0A2P2QB23_RHIMU
MMFMRERGFNNLIYDKWPIVLITHGLGLPPVMYEQGLHSGSKSSFYLLLPVTPLHLLLCDINGDCSLAPVMHCLGMN